MNDGIQGFELNATTQRWFVISGIAVVPVLCVGMIMARALPPPSPTFSAARIAHMYSQHPLVIQTGCVLMMVGFACWGLWCAVITLWIWRMESRQYPLLTFASAILVGFGLVAFEMTPIGWALVAFRAGQIAPDITRTINDFTWFLFFLTWPPFTAWFLVIAIAILRDRHSPSLFPRFLGWATVVTGILFIGSGFVGFTKTGPFAWDGGITFWFELVIFGLWEIPMDLLLLKAIAKEERRLKEEVHAGEVTSVLGAMS
jgi:hypothetical protein